MGGGIKKDLEKAAEYLKIAEGLGSTMAAFTLGYAYYQGEGVTQNIETAVLYFKKAGNPETPCFSRKENKFMVRDSASFKFIKDSDFNISKKNLREAIQFYDSAEKLAPGMAYWNLGLIYGLCEKIKNVTKAEEYVKKAAYLGCPEAIELLKKTYIYPSPFKRPYLESESCH